MNNSIFFNLGFYAACWAHFMYHEELWPTSVGHPVSSFNSSLDFAGGKHHQKIIIPIFRHVLQNFAIPGCFPYNSYYYIFYLLFVWLVCFCSLWLYFSPGKGKDHHSVSSEWRSTWFQSNTGLSTTQYEQIPIIFGVWPFWPTPFFFRSIAFWQVYG